MNKDWLLTDEEIKEQVNAKREMGTRQFYDAGKRVAKAQHAKDMKKVVEWAKPNLIKTFAQTVEYGAMCTECCSNLGDNGKGKALCEMADHPLEPEEYCPQQILAINNFVKSLLQAGEGK